MYIKRAIASSGSSASLSKEVLETIRDLDARAVCRSLSNVIPIAIVGELELVCDNKSQVLNSSISPKPLSILWSPLLLTIE